MPDGDEEDGCEEDAKLIGGRGKDEGSSECEEVKLGLSFMRTMIDKR